MVVEGIDIVCYPGRKSAKEIYGLNLSKFSDIQGHLPYLFECAKGNVLEIGVRSGVSTSALLAGVESHGGHVTSIDISACDVFPDHPQWTFIRARSGHRLSFRAGEFDLVFIDADHSYEACLADLIAYGLNAPRILLHDYDFPSVQQAIEDFRNRVPYALKIHSGSYGLAELISEREVYNDSHKSVLSE